MYFTVYLESLQVLWQNPGGDTKYAHYAPEEHVWAFKMRIAIAAFVYIIGRIIKNAVVVE